MSRPCPTCGEATLADASFCEACGADLPAGPPCVSCGAGPDRIEGEYCLTCGHRQPAPNDHREVADGRIGGTTDRGRRHHRNEDAMAFSDTGDALVMVVCDGVSTTDRPDQAIAAAVQAALATLVGHATPDIDARAAFGAAAHAAQEAVLTIPSDPAGRGSPSCTFVAAVVTPNGSGAHDVHVGWLGDSRAYWVGAHPTLLTSDHTWAAEVVAADLLAPEEAFADPRASTITRFLGADAVDVVPSVATFRFADPGRIVVCSDGLWNYAPAAVDLAARPEWDQPTVLEQSAALTRFALEAGGHDNITTVVGALGAD